MKNAWVLFLKQHKGQGKDTTQLARDYKPYKKTRDEIKRKGTCAPEIQEVKRLKKALEVKKRQLKPFLELD